MALSHEIRFTESPAYTSLTYFVHRGSEWKNLAKGAVSGRWTEATKYNPPLPKALPGKGIPYFVVNSPWIELRFFSAPEIDCFCEIYARKILPRPKKLAESKDLSDVNHVWLSQIPKPALPARIALTEYVFKHSHEFRSLIAKLI